MPETDAAGVAAICAEIDRPILSADSSSHNRCISLGLAQGLDAVVQRLERHPPLGKLALEILVAVDAELGIVGKVGAELQEERPEVFIDAIEIVVVDHRGGFHDPRIGSACEPTAAPLRAHDPRLLLGLADIEYPFTLGKLPHVLLCDVVFALPLLEGNQINALVVDELIDVANERLPSSASRPSSEAKRWPR